MQTSGQSILAGLREICETKNGLPQYYDSFALGYIASMVGSMLEGPADQRRRSRAELVKMLGRGRCLLNAAATKTIPPAPPLCGKLHNGDPCDLPSGTSCPDCGPSLIDYNGE